jgi:hypothetical protein
VLTRDVALQVLLPYNPWDIGTSRILMRNASSDAEVRALPSCVLDTHGGVTARHARRCDCVQAMRQLVDATGADGYNGDTMVTHTRWQPPSAALAGSSSYLT